MTLLVRSALPAADRSWRPSARSCRTSAGLQHRESAELEDVVADSMRGPASARSSSRPSGSQRSCCRPWRFGVFAFAVAARRQEVGMQSLPATRRGHRRPLLGHAAHRSPPASSPEASSARSRSGTTGDVALFERADRRADHRQLRRGRPAPGRGRVAGAELLAPPGPAPRGPRAVPPRLASDRPTFVAGVHRAHVRHRTPVPRDGSRRASSSTRPRTAAPASSAGSRTRRSG